MKWVDALDLALKTFAQQRGVDSTGLPKISNRDASGLILFARAAEDLRKKSKVPSAEPFDWYWWAKPTLGWYNRGDRFQMAPSYQTQAMPAALARGLIDIVRHLAEQLDDAHVPFRVLRDPRGTEATYKQLALDAYKQMQKVDPLSADVHPHKEKLPKKPPAYDPRPVLDRPPVVVPAPVVVAPATATTPEIVVPQPMVKPGPATLVYPPPAPAPPVSHRDDDRAPPSAPSRAPAASAPSGPVMEPEWEPPPVDDVMPPSRPAGVPPRAAPPPAAYAPPPSDDDVDEDAAPPPTKKKPKPKKPDGGTGALLLLLFAAWAMSD